ncbi:MAG: hypothetical protein INR69_10725 [Mucilaginibacter polytrichastri]|nr:hypothetical protein [Mucilaginibacter polytrichastri]
MENQNPELDKNYDFLFYLIGLLTGAFVGLVINVGAIYILVGAVLGLLSGGLFLKAAVKGREDQY